MKLFRMGVVVAFLLTFVFASISAGQSLTSGSIEGRITDPAGAVVVNAAVGLKSLDTGEQQTTTTGSDGTYHFNLLKPGHFEVTVTAAGFAKVVRSAVTVGQTVDVSVALEISKTAETIEVSAAAPLISTEPGVATSYSPEEVALLPAAGGDI